MLLWKHTMRVYIPCYFPACMLLLPLSYRVTSTLPFDYCIPLPITYFTIESYLLAC